MTTILKVAVVTVLTASLHIEFMHWAALWRDLRGARSIRERLGYLLKPPGWRPDGEGETTEDLRLRAGLATPVPDTLPGAGAIAGPR